MGLLHLEKEFYVRTATVYYKKIHETIDCTADLDLDIAL